MPRRRGGVLHWAKTIGSPMFYCVAPMASKPAPERENSHDRKAPTESSEELAFIPGYRALCGFADNRPLVVF
jgi:hypothetical protein